MIRPSVGLTGVGTISGMMNSIRTSMSGDYQAAVGVAVETNDSIKQIGEQIAAYDPSMNVFYKTLVNRIAFEIVKNKMYKNPWADLKKGILEMGETIEEIFVNIADPNNFDPEKAETEIFKRVKADVRTAFHTMNYQKFYKATRQRNELKKAFVSLQSMTDFVEKLIESMYTGAEYDEYITTKYMLCRLALDGKVTPMNIPEVETDSSGVLEIIKATANDFQFLSPNWNMSGVMNKTDPENMVVFIDTLVDAKLDVEQFAKAFNMDRAEFIGKKKLIDSFHKHDIARLKKLFGASFVPFTSGELTELQKIKVILADIDFFMIYDVELEADEIYNGEGKYFNHWLHAFKLFSASPFENTALFTTASNGITSVTCIPTAITLPVGASYRMGVNVVTTGFISSEVSWSLVGAESEDTMIDDFGVLVIGDEETAETITVTATAKKNTEKSGSCTVTIA
jgi:hypothetical protein